MAEVEESSPDQTERLVRSDRATLVSWEDRAPVYTGVSLSTDCLDNGPLHSQRRWRRQASQRERRESSSVSQWGLRYPAHGRPTIVKATDSPRSTDWFFVVQR